ncbi:hypothetical protein C7999DRAFT_27524 [Corynascus novoguineensis]|uniref:Rieske domain-containing protein n=1 Tax=Corynascus novoguineensis TaxID=1126955 RepID=A0AAN7D114_9PEZI|nr:hypothetical protein C7999DRAFT_27524 [Corynascus novoguineensis]
MNIFLNPFRAPARTGTEWFSVGVTSSFPDISPDGDGNENENEDVVRLCGKHGPSAAAGCKVFHVPKENPSQRTEVDFPADDVTRDLTDEVLVFQYRGKFHAIDHQCPHSSFPLSQGIPFDIEDFGIVLSAGLTCPKHNWSFDLFSGRSDRGNYKLRVWEVELRDIKEAQAETKDKEVWVRRKPRIG